ncbi:MAG: PilZ domain-containing protein [Pyrinomonadaceae bacterium]
MPREEERKDFIAQIELESASGRREARVSDISLGGCYVDTIVSVAVGESVRFELIQPNGGRLTFAGLVVYHLSGMGFGVQFTDLNKEQKQFLEEMIGS